MRISLTMVLIPMSALALSGCDRASVQGSALTANRDTLPNGAIVARYGALLDAADQRLTPELTLGSVDGNPASTFGDVRGIEAAADGTIYVLDSQASEVRAFDSDGAFVRTIATHGEGPGEITAANGMILKGDTLLWIQDHGKWQMLAIDRQGTEVARHSMHVRTRGGVWDGTVDSGGLFWKTDWHFDDEERPPEPGLLEAEARYYSVSFDPSTGVRDSVYLATVTGRTLISRRGSGHSYMGVPYDPIPLSVVDERGDVWVVPGGEYRIMRLSPWGDTMLIIEADVPGPPVTARDRSEFVSLFAERDGPLRRAAEEVADLMPSTRPAISGLLVDDRDQLWVRRGGTEESQPSYDVFARDGSYVQAIELDFTPVPDLPLRVRFGKVYALVTDEFDVPYVVRAGLRGD